MPGSVFCLASAAAFGSMAIFGKLAYDEGATVGTLLATRFVLAAALFWLLALGRLRALRRRDVALALALGAVGYGAQAGGYFTALERLDASLLSLLVYTYPVIVTGAAVALGRETGSRRTVLALVLASSGLVLVLAGASAGALDPVGTALALGTAIVYSAYILVSQGVAARVGPLALGALVCTGAAGSLTLGAAAAGDLHPAAVSAAGFGWLGGLAAVSTVAAIALFFAGLRYAGPTAASILSTLEPVVTVALAFVAFGESLGGAQLAGGALVLMAVLAVRNPNPKEAR
jgi:drug/metabolite transporter (DMT)-like permease